MFEFGEPIRILDYADLHRENPIKANAYENLRVLETLDRRDELQEAVSEYERRLGQRPRSLNEVAAASRLARRPAVDEAGIPFAYDPETGTVSVSTQSPLWRPK